MRIHRRRVLVEIHFNIPAIQFKMIKYLRVGRNVSFLHKTRLCLGVNRRDVALFVRYFVAFTPGTFFKLFFERTFPFPGRFRHRSLSKRSKYHNVYLLHGALWVESSASVALPHFRIFIGYMKRQSAHSVAIGSYERRGAGTSGQLVFSLAVDRTRKLLLGHHQYNTSMGTTDL